MPITFRSNPRIVLHGFSPDSPESISLGAKPSSLRGDFILVAEGAEAATGRPLTIFVSTVIAAVPYYYYMTSAHCVHGSSALACCQSAGLNWRWDWDAVAQLGLFEHVLGTASLHADIKRVPQASVVVVRGNQIEISAEPFWHNLFARRNGQARVSDAVGVLLEILSELPPENGYSLSLSAGYDSRVLLACLMHLGQNIVTASMGAADSTDPRIAEQLARFTGRHFERVEFSAEDYVVFAKDILLATSGEKLFNHWHTGIYSKRVGFNRASVHLAGSNGEFARSFYCDKGIVRSLLDALGILQWDRWLILKNSARRRVAPEILAAIGREAGCPLQKRLSASAQMKPAYVKGLRFGDGLDYFYAAERVRNFIGLGLALYRTEFPTMSPFLDARFIRFVSRLRRHDKLGCRLHRAIIGQLRPELLNWPTDESGRAMREEPGSLYFLKQGAVKAYQRHREAQELEPVMHWARSGCQELGLEMKRERDGGLWAKLREWNLAITIGAMVELLQGASVKRVS